MGDSSTQSPNSTEDLHSSDSEDEIEVPPEKADFQRFANQASGHSQIYAVGKDKIAKPCNPHEARVYEALSHNPIIQPFTPKYYGVIKREDNSNSSETRKFQERNMFILLENLTAPYRRACVMDLKLGQKNYSARLHSRRKVLRRKVKCSATTAAKLGLRLSGMRVYRPIRNSYCVRHSRFGNRLTEEALQRVVEQFLNDGLRTRIELIPKFLQRLRAMLESLQEQKTFDFMASSVLLIYEGDYTTQQDGVEINLDVRIIDFDHTQFLNKEEIFEDTGSVVGIQSLINILRKCYMSHARSKSFEGLESVLSTRFDKNNTEGCEEELNILRRTSEFF